MLPDECMRVLNDKYIQPTYRYDTGTASRELSFQYPMDAIRELIVNAIVHKDYSTEQEIQSMSTRICSRSIPEGY